MWDGSADHVTSPIATLTVRCRCRFGTMTCAKCYRAVGLLRCGRGGAEGCCSLCYLVWSHSQLSIATLCSFSSGCLLLPCMALLAGPHCPSQRLGYHSLRPVCGNGLHRPVLLPHFLESLHCSWQQQPALLCALCCSSRRLSSRSLHGALAGVCVCGFQCPSVEDRG